MKIQRIAGVIAIVLVGAWCYWSYQSEITPNTDSYVYELPYAEGTSHYIMQGYGGLFSHTNAAALDFSMPAGTPVYAARGGTIFRYKDDSNQGGPFARYHRRANYIMIRHDDGSIGCYWHLKYQGVVIKHGPVQKGALIGYSGATGFVLSAHLHFSVKPMLSYEKEGYIQTKFNTRSGVKLLRQGHSYEKPISSE